MRFVLYLTFAAITGCGVKPIDAAIASANSARAIGDSAHAIITDNCKPAYEAVKTPADFEAVDKRCLPLMKAYKVYVSSHIAAVVAIQQAQLGVHSETEALRAAFALGKASASVSSAVQEAVK